MTPNPIALQNHESNLKQFGLSDQSIHIIKQGGIGKNNTVLFNYKLGRQTAGRSQCILTTTEAISTMTVQRYS